MHKTVEEFAQAKNKLFSRGETNKVSELLKRMDLVWYNLVELHMREVVAEHLKEFHKDKPSANQDLMAILLLEAELAQTRKIINLFQARVGLPVTYNERSADRVVSSDLTLCLTWEEFKAQLAQLRNSTPNKQTEQRLEHKVPESTAEGNIEVADRIVEQVEDIVKEDLDTMSGK
ncbi:hypothetical protein F511_29675 [Dorcoceras hygrometricum]|uniref:Uncharacterized protein n=1 Tax=Dorcoceras hygrometricum TaxID=472368 RepID=A0A2Z7D9F6_9LAMI|nr:hypothetical protein F511_29675 [Dorcoceras hygrometricum]